MPLHSTAAQAETSRCNGSRSSGPTTEAGKATAARNSLRHGLAAGTFTLLAHEDPGQWEALRTALIDEYEPATPAEAACVERLARTFWRQGRLDAVETLVFAALLSPDMDEPEPHRPPLPSLATLARYRARIDKERRETEAELAQPQAARRHAAVRMNEPKLPPTSRPTAMQAADEDMHEPERHAPPPPWGRADPRSGTRAGPPRGYGTNPPEPPRPAT
jgi:hypothetical protein